jgi:hypothetical protein
MAQEPGSPGRPDQSPGRGVAGGGLPGSSRKPEVRPLIGQDTSRCPGRHTQLRGGRPHRFAVPDSWCAVDGVADAVTAMRLATSSRLCWA